MRKNLARVLLTTGTVATALMLAAPPAMATDTWTVTGGTNWTSAQASGTTFTMQDGSLSFTCAVGTAAGRNLNETSGEDNVISAITMATFGSTSSRCGGPLGSTAIEVQRTGTTSFFVAKSYNSTTAVTTGTIVSVDEIMTISYFLGTCTAEVKGTAGATYDNLTRALQFTTAGDSLAVASTSGTCLGIIRAGDVITVASGTLGETVTGSPTNPITISEP